MIGVFDSGLGGLSVLAAVARALPCADLMYLADTAHVPYGNKDDAFIRRRVLHIGRYLAGQGCRLLVVACNTATAAAVAALRADLPDIPVVGVEPGVKPAALASKSGRIAVLATESTARSARLARLIDRHAGALRVSVVACPGWATKVESLRLDDADFLADARTLLEPVLDDGVDQIVLGCTHYAFLRTVLQNIVAGRAELVDVADAVARQCLRLARQCDPQAAVDVQRGGAGSLTLAASASPQRLALALELPLLDVLRARLVGAPRLVEV